MRLFSDMLAEKLNETGDKKRRRGVNPQQQGLGTHQRELSCALVGPVQKDKT